MDENRSQPASLPLSSDLLRGADEIAAFIFGSAAFRRRVFHLKKRSNVPFFKIGSMISARKSVLLSWIESQERRGLE